MSRRGQTVDAHIYPSPDPAVVARIISTKGIEAAQERWHWCEKRTLMAIARSGRARTGIAAKHVSTRAHALDGREAVAVEASFVVGSMAAVDFALGVGKNAARALFYKRGLDLPKGHGERVAEGCLGRRIKAGDETAVAEREAKRIHARAVCDVLAAALALVPAQPLTGRYRLPVVDDALRTALAGLSPAAIEAVFPELAVAAAPAEEAVPVPAALPDPTPSVEVPAVSDPIPHIHRRAPDDSILRFDHADGQDLVVLAAHYGISPPALYAHWRRLNLSGRGRMAGFGAPQAQVEVPVVEVPVVEAPTQEAAPADVPVESEPVAPEPVAPSHPVDPYGALSPEEAVAVVAGIEASAPLGLHHLALAVRLASETGLTKAEAIAWVRADIHAVAAARVLPAETPEMMNAAIADQVFGELLRMDERGTRQ